ncbi:MAG: hypothetical protein Q4A83_02565 [Bacillota bacterium]|nr:hypothetical protein [Bacillota bacterium]
MRSEDLLKYIGGVDDEFVDELADDKLVPIASRRVNRHLLAVAACLAIVVLCAAVLMGVGVNVDRGQMTLTGNATSIPLAHNSIVMLDVNPSLQMEINDRNIVVSAEAINEDAAALMDELQLRGMTCDEAVKKTVAVLQDHEYITNLKNSILVTVVNPDESEAELIRQTIIDVIQLTDENTSYDFSIISQIFSDVSEYAELAESYHMSAGRAALIKKTCELYEDYSFEVLSECNIQTINQLFEYIPVPEFIQRIGTAAATVPEDFKAKLGIDGLSAEELISFTCAISDFYDKLCDYYDESDVAHHIGYVFDIVSTENADGTKLWAVLAENLSNELNTRCAIINLGDDAISDWCSGSAFREIVKYIDRIA